MHPRPDMNGWEGPPRSGEECVEVPLLVPGWQWQALEQAASARGLTIGQMLRQLIGAHLAQRKEAWPLVDTPHILRARG